MTDFTDEFDRRLTAMNRDRAPAQECSASINVYERLSTARAIARSLLTAPTNSDVLAVFAALMSAASTSTTRDTDA